MKSLLEKTHEKVSKKPRRNKNNDEENKLSNIVWFLVKYKSVN